MSNVTQHSRQVPHRDVFIADLHALAEWLAAHPDVPVPQHPESIQLSITPHRYGDQAARYAEVNRLCGGTDLSLAPRLSEAGMTGELWAGQALRYTVHASSDHARQAWERTSDAFSQALDEPAAPTADSGTKIRIEPVDGEVGDWLTARAMPAATTAWVITRRRGDRIGHVFLGGADNPADLVSVAKAVALTWRAEFVPPAQLVASAAVAADAEGMPQ
jgi:hypothetical protein